MWLRVPTSSYGAGQYKSAHRCTWIELTHGLGCVQRFATCVGLVGLLRINVYLRKINSMVTNVISSASLMPGFFENRYYSGSKSAGSC